MRRAALLLLAIVPLAAGVAIAAAPQPGPAQLKAAMDEARQATERSRAFDQQAAQATDAAARARAEAEALVARIQAAEAEITAAGTRVALVDARLQAQRARLAERQAPLVRLTAALQSMSRRPPALALLQPGSLDDAVRIRSVLAATLPRIRARTAELRAEIDAARALLAQQDEARRAMLASRADLSSRRTALAEFEARQRARSQGLVDLALRESDRALALGEEARALEQVVNERPFQQRLETSLAALPGPVLRPGTARVAAPAGPRFRLPVDGRVLTGVGELSDAGVHARGLVIDTAPDAPVVAPAAGTVLFAGTFRTYGNVVILDHGGGWTSVVTDLARLDVAAGQRVQAGTGLGKAGSDAPRLGVELRLNGRPVPITSLLQG